jgi:hypothetical protein
MTDDFPHVVFTPLAKERTTGQALATLPKELMANSMSVPSICGDSSSGHYALMVTEEVYLADSGVEFEEPTNPGTKPVHKDSATTTQITEGNRQYTADVTEFNLYANTEARLKLEAVPEDFTSAMIPTNFGYDKVSTLELIHHTSTTYGKVSADDLERNLANMNKPWTNNQPIESLFSQLRVALDFAQDTEPFSDSFAIRSALTNLAKTGLYTDAIRD